MSGRLPYGPRRTYPHMTGEEAEVWDRFLVKFPGRFDSVDYDFRVGHGEVAPEGFEENYSRMVTQLSQLRIDALAWNGEKPTIIEVKGRAAISALGALTGYRVLFVRDLPALRVPDIMLVCASITDDALHVFQSIGIPVEVV
jgi:hypothetical protein